MISVNPNDVIYSGTRQYSSTYIFWQLIGWFNAGTEEENHQLDLLGTSYLPLPSSCFGSSLKDYKNINRELFRNHWKTEKTLSLPFPKNLRQCFSDPSPSSSSSSHPTPPPLPGSDDDTSSMSPLLGSPVLDVGLGQVDAVENCLKEIFGEKYFLQTRGDGHVYGENENNNENDNDGYHHTQYDLHLPPEKPTAWVQCENCLKWRRVPFHVNVDSLPEKWYCHENTWDPEKATCDYPQDNFDSEKEATLLTNHVEIEPVQEGDWKDVYCLRNEVYYEAKAIKLRTIKRKHKEEGGSDESDRIEIKFHFKGWKPSQDEWIELGSERIAPHHLYTDVTSRTIRDQEKWQGKKRTTTLPSSKASIATATTKSSTKKGTKRKGKGEKEKLLQKKSKNSL